MLRITTRDVGLTQVATIWVGETKAIEFYTQTKHEYRSLQIAEKILADIIHDLIIDHDNSIERYKGND